MNPSFNSDDVKISLQSLTVHHIMHKIQKDAIELHPDFQRNAVWSALQQSRLIESILLRIPLPSFYIDKSNDTRWQVVDGFQRLSALRAFLIDETLELTGLEVMTELNGKSAGRLSPGQIGLIEDTSLNFIAIEKGTPDALKFVIFQRINTAGTNLNSQEIRHAMYGGPARVFLRELAETVEFRRATGDSVDVRRMEDRECVLRFMAFLFNPYDRALGVGGAPTLDALLNETMDELNRASAIQREEYAAAFVDSMDKAYLLFDTLAFREAREMSTTGPFRRGLFDAWSTGLRRFPKELLKDERVRDRMLRDSIGLMTGDAAFLAAIQPNADAHQDIVNRFYAVETLLDGYR